MQYLSIGLIGRWLPMRTDGRAVTQIESAFFMVVEMTSTLRHKKTQRLHRSDVVFDHCLT